MVQGRTIKMWMARITAVVALSSLVSCKNVGGFAGGGGGESGSPAPAGKTPTKSKETFNISGTSNGAVDMVFLLDTSDSMKDKIAALMGQLQGFVEVLSYGSNGLDYQVMILGVASKIQVNLKDTSRTAVIDTDVNSHSALWTAYNYLEGNTSKVPQGRIKLRPNAIKQLVVLTDDDAQNITATNFAPYLKKNKAKLGEVRVNGFVATDSTVASATCSFAAVGREYLALGRDPEIGGLIDDVCTGDWNQLLTRLAEQVRAGAGRQQIFTLKAKPVSVTSIAVTIDGQPHTAFSFDVASNRITIDTSKLAAGAHKIEVAY